MDNILVPPIGTFRTIFLYVGQWDATLLIVPDWDNHKYVLIDSNKDEENGINVWEFLKWKIPEGELIFINTHPHKDHLDWIKEVYEAVKVWEVWHSWHVPHKDSREAYNDLLTIIEDIGTDKEFYLKGTSDLNTIHEDKEETSKVIKKIWDVDFQVFSPAQYVINDIDEETEEQRRARIHEQCGVIKFLYKDKYILFTWDSDKAAWKNHITEYYKDVLKSDILSASHHGSRSFFKDSEEDEDIFEEHIKIIAPEYVIISAPKKSKHDHPHKDAVEIYEKYTEKDKIINLWDFEQSYVIDIDSNGTILTSYYDYEDEELNDEKKYTPQNPIYESTQKSQVRPYLNLWE